MKKLCFIVLLQVLCLGQIMAQTSRIKGFVYELSNGEPMVGVTIGLKGTTNGANTDVNGYFNIPKLEASTYTITVSTVGYEPIEKIVTLTADEILTTKFNLSKKSRELKRSFCK